MVQKNERGWIYIHSENCYVAPKKDFATYPPRAPFKSSTVAVKPITVKIKSEALMEASLEHSHDTRCRKKKNERRLTITSTPLELTNHARALTLLTNVPSPSKPPPTKKSKCGERFVGCCNCGLSSKCSTMRCPCHAIGRSCNACRSKCCNNITKSVPPSLKNF